MLSTASVNVLLPAQDGARARAFYRDVLGLTLATGPHDDPIVFTLGGGGVLALSEIPDRVPPDYPVTSFSVRGLAELVDELTARGVQFLPQDPAASFAGVRGTVRGAVIDYGVARSAFLRDTEGNVLALNEFVDP